MIRHNRGCFLFSKYVIWVNENTNIDPRNPKSGIAATHAMAKKSNASGFLKAGPLRTDWTMTLEGRPEIVVTVTIVGDSLIMETAEYESVLRAGVMVTVRTASVLQDGKLVGNLVATYRTPEGDEIVTGTVESTREQ